MTMIGKVVGVMALALASSALTVPAYAQTESPFNGEWTILVKIVTDDSTSWDAITNAANGNVLDEDQWTIHIADGKISLKSCQNGGGCRIDQLSNIHVNDHQLMFNEAIGTHENDTRKVFIELNNGRIDVKDIVFDDYLGVKVTNYTGTIQKNRPRQSTPPNFPQMDDQTPPAPRSDLGNNSGDPSVAEAKRHYVQVSCHNSCTRSWISCTKTLSFGVAAERSEGSRECDRARRSCDGAC